MSKGLCIVVGMLAGCHHSVLDRPWASPEAAGAMVTALAPENLLDHDLGTFVDASFRPITDALPILKRPIKYEPGTVSTECHGFESSYALAASVAANAGLRIGPLKVGGELHAANYAAAYQRFRYCEHFHCQFVLEARELDTTRSPPAGAAYVIVKIEYGSSAEFVGAATGTATGEKLDAAVWNGFMAWVHAGASTSYSESHAREHFMYSFRLRGMAPRISPGAPTGVLATSPAEFSMAYQEGKPTPILVSYLRVGGPIVEPAPPPPTKIEPGRYTITDFSIAITRTDPAGGLWDNNGSGPDLILTLSVDDQPVATCEEPNTFNPDCNQALLGTRLDIKAGSRISFRAIDDDGSDGFDKMGDGVLEHVTGLEAGKPLLFKTTWGVTAAAITLERAD